MWREDDAWEKKEAVEQRYSGLLDKFWDLKGILDSGKLLPHLKRDITLKISCPSPPFSPSLPPTLPPSLPPSFLPCAHAVHDTFGDFIARLRDMEHKIQRNDPLKLEVAELKKGLTYLQVNLQFSSMCYLAT